MKESNYRFYKAHIHKALEMVVCENGDMSFKGTDNAGVIHSQEILIFNSFDKHYYEYINDFKGYIVVLSVDFLQDIISSPVFEFKNVIKIDHNDWKKVIRILKHLFINNSKMSYLEKKANILLLFNSLNNYDIVCNKKDIHFKDISTQIFEYIENNYTEKITLESISKIFGYSTTYFSSLFSKILGNDLTFVSYLNQFRAQKVQEFKSMPKYHDEPMKTLIRMCGFESEETYYRTVRKNK